MGGVGWVAGCVWDGWQRVRAAGWDSKVGYSRPGAEADPGTAWRERSREGEGGGAQVLQGQGQG